MSTAHPTVVTSKIRSENAKAGRDEASVVRSVSCDLMTRLKDICVDCANPWTLANWWAPVLGYRVRPHTTQDLEKLRARGIEGPEADPCIAVDPLDGAGPSFWFNRVPETKHGKNRVHIDIFGSVEDLVSAGATVIERHAGWTVLADPEGNEFCVFPPPDAR
jgi:hypothetical protein